jgi:histidine triad (HIT) family protein
VPDCIFCDIVRGERPAHLVVDTDDVLGFLDARPVFLGHTLVVPKRHYVTLPDLPAALLAPFFTQVQRVAAAMVAGLGADGSFVAANNVVSQSVAHLHVHVVPRRRKDGLRGFFWPRHNYGSDTEMADYAARLRGAL